MKPKYLFVSKDLRAELGGRLEEVTQQVAQWDAALVLATTTADLVAALVEDYGMQPIAIHEDRMEQLPVQETKIDVSGDHSRAIFDRSRPFLVPGSVVTVVIPFDGHPALFNAKPSQQFVARAPLGQIRESEIVLTYVSADPTPENVRTFVTDQLSMIRKLVDLVNYDIETFAPVLARHAEEVVRQRRAQLQKDRGLEGALGIPVRRRADAPKAVPVVRKRLGLSRIRHQEAVGDRYGDEYAIDRSQYAEIIDIILGMGRAFERSPTTFAKLDEDQLRDHILLQLNGTFEGQAGGELFNGDGKTDILVRVEDRNVFIGECKIWHGERRFNEAIDQLLGYLVWRDTKAALVLFIREKDASSIIDKAEATIRSHANFKRAGRFSPDPATIRNFVMQQTGDAAREIEVALLPVVLRVPVDSASVSGPTSPAYEDPNDRTP
ncbi:MAG TPA: hypothetical protein VJ777_04720 [Mycobacterium sp.]|nr:hypothetical protein [Mycobacterium sp.]